MKHSSCVFTSTESSVYKILTETTSWSSEWSLATVGLQEADKMNRRSNADIS